MKNYCIFLFCCFALQFTAAAQSKQKATKAFLQQLNDIIKKSPGQHWAYEQDTMTVDSAFAINAQGILSVTIRYTNDTGVTIIRTAAPVNKIERIAYDLYLILEFKDDLVTFYKTETPGGPLKETGKAHLFHIGAPLPEDVKYQVKLQQALDKLLIHYPDSSL